MAEYEYRGYSIVAMENQFLRVVIAAGKGTDILEFQYKPLDVDFMWRSYNGLPPYSSPTISNPSGSFLDFYAGGWQEMLPNAGMNCVYKGASLGVHGEVCLLPWSYRIDRDSPEAVSVTFSVRTVRTPFYLEKTLTLNHHSPVLFIEERLLNEGDEPMDVMWGHHPAFGWPFVDDGCRLFLPHAGSAHLRITPLLPAGLRRDRTQTGLSSEGGRVKPSIFRASRLRKCGRMTWLTCTE